MYSGYVSSMLAKGIRLERYGDRIAFVAEKIDIARRSAAEFVQFGLRVQFKLRTLVVGSLLREIKERRVVQRPADGTEPARINAVGQKFIGIDVQDSKFGDLGTCGRKPEGNVLSVIARDHVLNGGYYSRPVCGGIKQTVFPRHPNPHGSKACLRFLPLLFSCKTIWCLRR